MSIDPNSSVPIFEQIASYVRRSVAAGVYKSGEMIPSLRAMALDLTVNPNTVQRAYEELEREGLIEARRGRGMYVTNNGTVAAKDKSAEAVYHAFDQGIRSGRDAKMAPEQIRTTFERAWRDSSGRTRSEVS
ncbi:MAG: GntR family transcriptional regulator [Phycisphaerae bacterium]